MLVVSVEVPLIVGLISSLFNTVTMNGWAFINGREDNNDLDVFVLLKGKETEYIVATDRVYRPDVAEVFSNQRYVEFIGYQTKFEVTSMIEGTYQVYLVKGDWCTKTEHHIVVTV